MLERINAVKNVGFFILWLCGCIIGFFLIGLLMSSCTSKLEQTEHGWKGKHLTATRDKVVDNGLYLFSIKFTENQFYGKIDRVELARIVEDNHGDIWISNYEGMHMVIFEGMDTRAEQDSVIQAVLPQLEKWYRDN